MFDEVVTGVNTEVAVSSFGPAGSEAFNIVPSELPSYYYITTDAALVLANIAMYTWYTVISSGELLVTIASVCPRKCPALYIIIC